MITKVLVKRTLKAGDKSWGAGTIVEAPVPRDLLMEVKRGWVEVLAEQPDPPLEGGTTLTTMGKSSSTPSEIFKTRPKAKLRVRRTRK
jgi:hypothetical protein